MMKNVSQIIKLFEDANGRFLSENKYLLESNVSERTLCGNLMLYLHDLLRADSGYDGYWADVEYNRNRGNTRSNDQVIIFRRGMNEKGILQHGQFVPINCDLIVHSRGRNPIQDNLLALEMKKDYRRDEAENDRNRLRALTRDSYDDLWHYDGKTLPACVCRYILGVYYEIDYHTKEIVIEYYHGGALCYQYHLDFDGNRIEPTRMKGKQVNP